MENAKTSEEGYGSPEQESWVVASTPFGRFPSLGYLVTCSRPGDIVAI